MKSFLFVFILAASLGLGGCETAKDIASTPFMALDLLKSEHSKIGQDQDGDTRSSDVQPTSTQSTSTDSATSTASIGDPRVKKAQILLNYSNISAKLTEDGLMGRNTREAIKEWQKVNGFAVDGLVDSFLMQVKG
ncbi:putative peptidoglycan binding domain protein [bacterium BMS3Abin11]|nr:putative peptidoglycan binding domain protein [bacterium BMS3Abin11]